MDFPILRNTAIYLLTIGWEQLGSFNSNFDHAINTTPTHFTFLHKHLFILRFWHYKTWNLDLFYILLFIIYYMLLYTQSIYLASHWSMYVNLHFINYSFGCYFDPPNYSNYVLEYDMPIFGFSWFWHFDLVCFELIPLAFRGHILLIIAFCIRGNSTTNYAITKKYWIFV